jgi:hypothetical protein
MGTPRIPSVDSDTNQFPDSVRARMAANLLNPATPEGAAIGQAGVGVRTFTSVADAMSHLNELAEGQAFDVLYDAS